MTLTYMFYIKNLSLFTSVLHPCLQPFSYFLHLVFPPTKKRLSKFLNFVILLQLIIVYMQVLQYF